MHLKLEKIKCRPCAASIGRRGSSPASTWRTQRVQQRSCCPTAPARLRHKKPFASKARLWEWLPNCAQPRRGHTGATGRRGPRSSGPSGPRRARETPRRITRPRALRRAQTLANLAFNDGALGSPVHEPKETATKEKYWKRKIESIDHERQKKRNYQSKEL